MALNKLFIAIIAILPVICAGILHMVIVTQNRFPKLALPIKQSWFGHSKTWRGVLIMPVLTAIFSVLIYPIISDSKPDLMQILQQQPYWLTGALLGLAYSLAELPNSALKRRLGIPPGRLPKRKRWLFITLDQLDSVLACCLTLMLFLNFDLLLSGTVLMAGFILALVIKRLLYICGYKNTPT